jgi:pSer/pThr/pTyr-binding forkhead associated (FHA) protein
MPYLRIYAGGRLLEQYELKADRTLIGRASDNDVVLPERGVSKHHGIIDRVGDDYVYCDNGSVNGSFVGDDRVRVQPLRFWDEIRISGYALRFMAKARLPGEESGAVEDLDRHLNQDETMELDLARLADLATHVPRRKLATLVISRGSGNAENITLDGLSHLIGKGQDIAVGGWLSPRAAARIQRRPDGLYLTPHWRGRVLVNGSRIVAATRLRDGDQLEVSGTRMRFLYRLGP